MIYSYKGAGHIFAGNGIINIKNVRIATGGTAEGNKRAKIQSIKAIDAFLIENHKQKITQIFKDGRNNNLSSFLVPKMEGKGNVSKFFLNKERLIDYDFSKYFD